MKRINYYSGRDFNYTDSKRERITVDEPSEEQLKLLKEIFDVSPVFDTDPDYNVHDLWHRVPNYEGDPYAYMEALEKFASENPDVQQFGFDDDSFMTSYGFIVPHKSKYEHMGYSVIFTTQVAPPYTIFLYPGHLESLLRGLGKAKEILNSVPETDITSPRYLRKEELIQQLLDTTP